MTKTELRAYVVAHPNNKVAFYVFVDRFAAEESSKTFAFSQSKNEVQDIEHLIQQKVNQ